MVTQSYVLLLLFAVFADDVALDAMKHAPRIEDRALRLGGVELVHLFLLKDVLEAVAPPL